MQIFTPKCAWPLRGFFLISLIASHVQLPALTFDDLYKEDKKVLIELDGRRRGRRRACVVVEWSTGTRSASTRPDPPRPALAGPATQALEIQARTESWSPVEQRREPDRGEDTGSSSSPPRSGAATRCASRHRS